MTRRPTRLTRVLSSALAAATLLASAACSDDGGQDGARASGVTASPAARKQPASSPSPTLSESGARAALITEADIEDDWTQVKDSEAADWHESLLIGDVDVADFLTAKSDASDCQKLLDNLYDNDLLGKPSGTSALRGFEEGNSRLLYQVAAYDRSDLDSALAWLKTLPDECDQFTATEDGQKRTVQVIETDLPHVGDDRQGLRVTVQGKVDGDQTTLTQDVGVVRVGSDAITVTAGGLDGGEEDSVDQAVKLGTQRLKDVLAGKTPAASPSEIE
ncbi:hypothetical protein [Streptomyces sp. HD]|uniref:hypothetical protein n=1 Tax=Streptomyces sp. HD TaxID=3020892 RepID=UPI00232C6EF8|nr:hypothetical protein [Streptomyces sp. HD]MDC0767182.1 hypothetical protein [Streptomyces sp. HD]